MDFLDKMGKLAKTVGEKTGDAVEIGKINLKINQAEGKIKDAKQDLGDLMYLLYRNGRTLPEDAAAICQEIKSLEETIAGLEADKAAVKEPAKEEPEAEEAPVEKKEELPGEEAREVATEETSEGQRVCPECGKEVEPEARFCGNCGCRFED